jgi:hypothetical protein
MILTLQHRRHACWLPRCMLDFMFWRGAARQICNWYEAP